MAGLPCPQGFENPLKNKMTKLERFLLVMAVVIVTYPGAYVVLRLSKYFVRQEFLSFGCSESVMDRLKTEYPAAVQLWTESERNQIGCGRIQKDKERFGEFLLLPVFRPLGELEMRVRGFNHSTMSVFADYYDSGVSPEGGPPRLELLTDLAVTREEQGD